ncbi:complement resistance protein TraT [Chromatiaceae bacterium AAb-1]|nr:complement resistance protein TraT [Chromatiaceae bacterium AAb-1]
MRLWGLILLMMPLTGCVALHTGVAKSKLDVQTRMTQTIYLDPVEPEQRTIFIDIRQTAAEYQLPLADDIRNFLLGRGYQLVDSPQAAQYWLQVNVRAVVKERPDVVLSNEAYAMTPQEIHALLYPGMLPPEDPVPLQQRQRRDRHTAVFVDTAITTDFDSKDVAKALVVMAVWAGAEYLGSQLVQDKYYTMLTDVQVAERIDPDSPVLVEETSHHQLLQGDSGELEQLWQRATDRRKYQVRVVSFANKANLKWQDAEQPLHQGLLRSLAGIF